MYATVRRYEGIDKVRAGLFDTSAQGSPLPQTFSQPAPATLVERSIEPLKEAFS